VKEDLNEDQQMQMLKLKQNTIKNTNH